MLTLLDVRDLFLVARFKHHMVDLVFMEKIARWLTNTQVKIKAEVADSNTQAQKLSQFLADLDRRIDAAEKPNPDKEVRFDVLMLRSTESKPTQTPRWITNMVP